MALHRGKDFGKTKGAAWPAAALLGQQRSTRPFRISLPLVVVLVESTSDGPAALIHGFAVRAFSTVMKRVLGTGG